MRRPQHRRPQHRLQPLHRPPHSPPAAAAKPAAGKAAVGVVLPTKDEPRWLQDQAVFQKAGFEPLFSQGDSAKEKANVEALISQGVKVLDHHPAGRDGCRGRGKSSPRCRGQGHLV